jgi:ubiquinone biosynthesis protein
VLLQKTLLNIEGLGRQLYPQLDLWATAKPFMERWLRNRHHPASLLKALSDGGFDSLRALPLWPAKVNENLRHLRHVVGQQQQAISTLLEDNRAAKRHTTRMRWLGAALLALGALLWPAGLAAGAVDGPALVAALAGLVGFALLLRG